MELREQTLEELNAPQDATLTGNEPETVADETSQTELPAVETGNDVALLTEESTELPVAIDADEEATPSELPAAEMTKESVIEALTLTSEKDGALISREEVARLKQVFYAIRKNELLAEKEQYLAEGNEESTFLPTIDPLEEKLHGLLNSIKEKKAAYLEELDTQRRANLDKKRAIINELTAMSDDTDNVNRHYQRVRELTQEFKAIGEVPAPDQTEVWRSYQSAVERFYDQLKVNKDLRDYDFKKNLEQKELLISEAEKLNDTPDIITAFRRLQELHDKWREVGPVAKELRDEIWARFKDASAAINKRYQTYFEERKARERDNEEKKTALCERIEALDFTQLKSHQAWEQMTRDILAAQEEWKKLGFAAKKVNNAIFSRFRKTCDDFFAAKAEFFRNIRDTHAANLEKKTALCERAESIKDSTDWKKTGDEFVELQKQWKAVGPVERKHSDAIWQRFMAACDYFFEQRKKNTSGVRKAEHAALKAKQEIIAKLKALAENTPDRQEAIKQVKDLTALWQQTGHVPYKEKDRIREEYRVIVNSLYDSLDINESRQHMANFTNAIEEIGNDENRLYRERERTARALEQKRGELKTYDNNIGFFNITSKNGNSLLRDMERRMQRIKDDIKTLEEKLAIIDSKL